jgi:hypothetical protein
MQIAIVAAVGVLVAEEALNPVRIIILEVSGMMIEVAGAVVVAAVAAVAADGGTRTQTHMEDRRTPTPLQASGPPQLPPLRPLTLVAPALVMALALALVLVWELMPIIM